MVIQRQSLQMRNRPVTRHARTLSTSIIMFLRSAIATGLVGVGLASAQTTYADNQVPLSKSPDYVSANFPDVDTELLSPAYLNPGSVPDGFVNGTSGPTSDEEVGE